VLERSRFQRFLHLTHSRRVPDAKTIWVWRERLKKHDAMGDISAAIAAQLHNAGFIARGGQIIDASIVHAPIQRNTREENAAIKHGEAPENWSHAKRAQKDVDARWTNKHGKSFYGYTLHAHTDRRWGFIRQYAVTAANVHDSQVFEAILDPMNTAKRVMADSAYADKSRQVQLARQRYRVDIQHKGVAGKPLSAAQQRRNHRIAKDRAFGEHPFARLAQMGGKCLRHIGLARATVTIGLKVAAHNVQRLARLKERGIVPA
jgi:transposase, IS5 family